MTSDRHTPENSYLDAARAAILAVGWSRTTLTDIARRAGVSRMTLYRRWPDTQTLLADLMTREWAGVVERSSVETTTPAHLAHTIVTTVQALRANALVQRIVDVDPEVLLPYLLQRRGRSQEHVAELTEATIIAGQADGSIRAGDPVTMARSLVLTAHGFVLSAQTMVDDAVAMEALDAELTRMVHAYLEPR